MYYVTKIQKNILHLSYFVTVRRCTDSSPPNPHGHEEIVGKSAREYVPRAKIIVSTVKHHGVEVPSSMWKKQLDGKGHWVRSRSGQGWRTGGHARHNCGWDKNRNEGDGKHGDNGHQ